VSPPRTGSQGPWVAHFEKLRKVSTLEALVRRIPAPVHGLNDLPVEVACKRLFAVLEDIYIPGPAEINLLLQMVERALAHAQQWYPDGRTFLRNIYSTTLDMPSAVPICLMGLSGVGKSALQRALCKIFEPKTALITVADDHSQFPWAPLRLALIKRDQSASAVLKSLCARSFPNSINVEATGDWLYRTGACMLVLDEMQYLTHGERSRIMVLKLLLLVAGLGVPMLYICNYSLVHRLLKLPHESRQAVLGELRLLAPSLAESAEWLAYLKAIQDALPDLFGFDLLKNAVPLWNYVAGLKRNLHRLLVAAYRGMRNAGTAVITWEMVEAAYKSSYYFAARQEVEALITHAVTGKRISRDLICPFEVDSNSEYEAALKDLQRQVFVGAVEQAALSKAEKQALAAVKKEAQPKAPKVLPVEKVVRSKAPKRPVTSSSLVDAAKAWLKS
jgi:hypothetical protein